MRARRDPRIKYLGFSSRQWPFLYVLVGNWIFALAFFLGVKLAWHWVPTEWNTPGDRIALVFKVAAFALLPGVVGICVVSPTPFMRRELKSIAEYKKPRNDAFSSVVRSFGEVNSRFQALAVESVGRAVEIQSQFVGKAYDTYISEISKLGRMFFVGFGNFTSRPQELPHANLNESKAADRQQAASAETKVDPDPAKRRTAAQSMTTKRKTGTVAKG